MCRRKEWKGEKVLNIGGFSYDVILVSFGDIRINKQIYG